VHEVSKLEGGMWLWGANQLVSVMKSHFDNNY